MRRGAVFALALSALATPGLTAEDFKTKRDAMVERIRHLAQSMADETGRTSIGGSVLAAMSEVPRHEFVPEGQQSHAYKNRPLPIGFRQTISQPLVVALMTDLLELEPGDKVLEIGTGSGYQAAVLAKLVRQVYSIEIVKELGERAAATLSRLGYSNVTTKVGDGYNGWAEFAPFDAIIVTAAAGHVPPALVEQLTPGGRMVIPVGDVVQDLLVITKAQDGSTLTETNVPVRFVPLTRDDDALED